VTRYDSIKREKAPSVFSGSRSRQVQHSAPSSPWRSRPPAVPLSKRARWALQRFARALTLVSVVLEKPCHLPAPAACATRLVSCSWIHERFSKNRGTLLLHAHHDGHASPLLSYPARQSFLPFLHHLSSLVSLRPTSCPLKLRPTAIRGAPIEKKDRTRNSMKYND
jgi:hypothetical protein